MVRKILYFAMLFLVLHMSSAMAQERSDDTLAADSSNFVTASLVVSAPSEALYSVFGHLALRMECPTHQLDYIFTFESDTDVNAFMTFIAGKAQAKCIAVPGSVFINDGQAIGREIKQYKLNLTHHEKQELWRLLDNDMMAGSNRHFNLLFDNCVHSTIANIQACLVDDEFEWGPTHPPYDQCDGDVFRQVIHPSPWAEFIYITVVGTIYDNHSAMEYRTSPETLIPLLREARLVDKVTGEKRPVITDEGTVLVKERQHLKATPFSPLVAFGTLLAVTLLVTLAEWRWGKRKKARVFDVLLFTAQALIGLLLLFITFYSELFDSNWNWYLIIFNPLPLLFLLFCKKRQPSMIWWSSYSAVLTGFLLATPFLKVLDLPHQLITGSLLVRSLSLLFQAKKKKTSK